MDNETREDGLSRRNFLIGLGGGVIGAAALASAATPERTYIGANTSWVDFGEGTRAFLTQPQQGKAPFRAVILGHERYGYNTPSTSQPSLPLLAMCVWLLTWLPTGTEIRRP